ncbi:MAG: hypothetical protein ACRCU2_23835, partial [Planktothrix sp.]
MESDQDQKEDRYTAEPEILPQSSATDTLSSLEILIREFGLDPYGPVQCGLRCNSFSEDMWVFYGALISYINRQWGDSLENQRQVLKRLSSDRSFSDHSGYIFLMENTTERHENSSGRNFKRAILRAQSRICLLSILFYGVARTVCSGLRFCPDIAESALLALITTRSVKGSITGINFYLNRQTI